MSKIGLYLGHLKVHEGKILSMDTAYQTTDCYFHCYGKEGMSDQGKNCDLFVFLSNI